MKQTRLLAASDPDTLNHVLATLQGGGTVVFPTDTVYGLAADVHNPAAIELLFEIKERPKDQAIAVLLGTPSQLAMVTEKPSDAAMQLAGKFWPGALTLVVPRHPDIPALLSPLPTIGVRVPDHAVAQQILQAAGPLAVTSANLSGQANASTAQQAAAQLDGRVDVIVDGGTTPGGVPSTVVDMTGSEPKILRPGPVDIFG